MKIRWLAGLLAIILLVSGCGPAPGPSDSGSPPSLSVPPPLGDSLRGVWVSFLELDPLLRDADPATAAARLDGVMATCKEAGLNTLFFHVRAHGDAYYASSVYPAAEAAAPLLRQGFDPLAYAVEAAHREGLALHAWVNPYRLGDTPTEDSFAKEGVYYANPGADSARRRVLDGVRELLRGYAVDGIHFDDYFYPAGMAADGEDFEAIPAGENVRQWRQAQVDTLVSAVYSLCRQAGRTFGISPMASIERNRTEAFANVSRWMTEPGYVDYLCPQLYTGFLHETSPFPALLERWATHPRRQEVRLYIGLALYKVGLENDPYAGSGGREWATPGDILARQITALHKRADGFVLFRQGTLTDPAVQVELENIQKVLL